MKRFAQLLALAVMLQSFVPASSLLNAQTHNAKTNKKVARSSTKSAKSAVPAAYAQPLRQFEDFVRRQMALDQTPGMSIGFMKDDYVWAKGYGYADLENRSPAKAESAYRLASVT